MTSLSFGASKQVIKTQWETLGARTRSTRIQWWRRLKLNNLSAPLMSGCASAHLPIIIWLSSVAVFSAPLTHNPTNRRGKTAKLSSLQPDLFFPPFHLFFFLCDDNNSIDSNSFPSKGVIKTCFSCTICRKNLDLLVSIYLRGPWVWWMSAVTIFHCGFWSSFLPWLHCRWSLIFFHPFFFLLATLWKSRKNVRGHLNEWVVL